MAELADALDLGSSAERREGSSPFIRIEKNPNLSSLVRGWGFCILNCRQIFIICMMVVLKSYFKFSLFMTYGLNTNPSL